jgi:signal transduction histidine kinase
MSQTNGTAAATRADSVDEVSDELARMLLHNVPLVTASSVLVGGLSVGLLFPYVDHSALVLWCVAVTVLLAVRVLLVTAWYRQSDSEGGHVVWAWLYTGVTFFSGTAWGFLAVLFVDGHQPIALIGISMTLVGIAAGTVALYSSWPAAWIAFTMPALGLLSYSVTRLGESFAILGAMVLVAFVVYLGLALLAWTRLRRTVMMQFQNRELARRLSAEKVRVEEANEAKSQLLAAISHDLRQPLQSVRLYTDLLRQQSAHAGDVDVYDKLEHSMEALTGMFDQLQDLSRMDARQVEVRMQRVDLRHLAERIHSQFLPIADHEGIQLDIDRPDLWGWADPVLLGRVLDNLVSNALRYAGQGSVRVLFERRDDMIGIDVLDSGPGIPPGERQRVFDAFYQLQNVSRQRSEGLGIGLAIVRRLCALMDIDVEILSTGSGGTRVRLRLRAADDCGPPNR